MGNVRRFAYVGKERHNFEPWLRKKRSWRVLCSCKRMLEKSGAFEEIFAAWQDHIELEGERREQKIFWYEYPD
jgi:hypothetical protein